MRCPHGLINNISNNRTSWVFVLVIWRSNNQTPWRSRYNFGVMGRNGSLNYSSNTEEHTRDTKNNKNYCSPDPLPPRVLSVIQYQINSKLIEPIMPLGKCFKIKFYCWNNQCKHDVQYFHNTMFFSKYSSKDSTDECWNILHEGPRSRFYRTKSAMKMHIECLITS